MFTVHHFGEMPVATAENYVDNHEKQQMPNRPRRKSTSVIGIVEEAETARQMAAAYHHADNQPSASNYMPQNSPILNLSPNLSPESHADSASPVFELLDSNQRRTYQGRRDQIASSF